MQPLAFGVWMESSGCIQASLFCPPQQNSAVLQEHDSLEPSQHVSSTSLEKFKTDGDYLYVMFTLLTLMVLYI